MKFSGVYCITNNINQKIYIGSSKNIHKRWIAHLYHLKNNTHHNRHIQNAYNKYGIEKFSISVLEQCNKDHLFETELKWFRIKQIPNHNICYNILSNPRGGIKKRSIRKYTMAGNLISIYMSTSDAIVGTNLTTEGISSCCNLKYKSHRGFLWRWDSDKLDIINPVCIREVWDSVYLFDLNTNKYERFDNVKELSNKIGILCETVYKLLHHKNLYTKNYVIVSANNDSQAIKLYNEKCIDININKIERKKRVHNLIIKSVKSRMRPIVKMDLSGNDLIIFESLKAGAIAVGVTPSTILSVIQGKTNTGGGYKWKYKEK